MAALTHALIPTEATTCRQLIFPESNQRVLQRSLPQFLRISLYRIATPRSSIEDPTEIPQPLPLYQRILYASITLLTSCFVDHRVGFNPRVFHLRPAAASSVSATSQLTEASPLHLQLTKPASAESTPANFFQDFDFRGFLDVRPSASNASCHPLVQLDSTEFPQPTIRVSSPTEAAASTVCSVPPKPSSSRHLLTRELSSSPAKPSLPRQVSKPIFNQQPTVWP